MRLKRVFISSLILFLLIIFGFFYYLKLKNISFDFTTLTFKYKLPPTKVSNSYTTKTPKELNTTKITLNLPNSSKQLYTFKAKVKSTVTPKQKYLVSLIDKPIDLVITIDNKTIVSKDKVEKTNLGIVHKPVSINIEDLPNFKSGDLLSISVLASELAAGNTYKAQELIILSD